MVVKEEVPDHGVAPMQGFAFNTRRPILQDPRVREAIGYAFDFEWTNKTLMYGAYIRTDSYFDNSDLGSRGLPMGAVLALLAPFRDRPPPQRSTAEFSLPTPHGSGNPRLTLPTPLRILPEAAWTTM